MESSSPPTLSTSVKVIKIPSSDTIKRTPSSPTDNMLSPCTKKLFGGKGKKPSMPFAAREKSNPRLLTERNKAIEQPTDIPIVLGSLSANRREVLDKHGWIFATSSPNIDEKAIRDDDPLELPLKIAIAKADALISNFSNSKSPTILITADQIVLFNKEIREKPTSFDEAREFLSSYSNQRVSTISAIVVTHIPSGRQASEVDVATVTWGTISDEVVERVLARGEIFDSAGGFRIEDPDLRPLILSIEGTEDSVFGMPMAATVRCVNAVCGDRDRDGEHKAVAEGKDGNRDNDKDKGDKKSAAGYFSDEDHKESK